MWRTWTRSRLHVAEVAGANPYLAPVPLGGTVPSNPCCAPADFFKTQATGKWQMSDPDGNWIDITDE